MISPYAKEMLQAKIDGLYRHRSSATVSSERMMILNDVFMALFGPPSREVAGTCVECGAVADVFGEDYCRECWGER